MVRFSIIMPLYNKVSYVRKALESVVAQTFQDWELIVVDDGSTDGSREEVSRWLQEHSDLLALQQAKLISQPNAGVSTARNNGVRAAQGEYICFLDADDWWALEFLYEMNRVITQYPDAGIYGSNYYYVKNRMARPMQQGVRLAVGEAGYINYCQSYAQGLIMPLTSISVSMPRTRFEEMGGFKSHLTLGEDFDLWIRIALACKVVFLNKPLAYYNQDVPVSHRATRNLHQPECHMLFNLSYLEPEERINPDYKRLIDKLRVTGLRDYYLSTEYRKRARIELQKVDWTRLPASVAKYYQRPVWLLRAHRAFMRVGSYVKQQLIKCFLHPHKTLQ